MAIVKQPSQWFLALLSLTSLPRRLWRLYKRDLVERREQELLADAAVYLIELTPDSRLNYETQLVTNDYLANLVKRIKAGDVYAALINRTFPRYVFVSVSGAFKQLPEHLQHSVLSKGLEDVGVNDEVMYINAESQQVLLALRRAYQAAYLLHDLHGEKAP